MTPVDLDALRESSGWLAMKGHMHEAKQLRAAADELAALREIGACLEHAVELGYFAEGGSTENWARQALAAWRGSDEKCQHHWDRAGERCVKCGEKDWM